MTTAVPRYLSAGLSDQGFIRPNNEDRVYYDDVRGIFLVIDGMGGHEAGEQAAEIALERLRLRLERQTDSVEQRLREAITLANNAIFEAAQTNPDWKGMACVLTAAVIEDGLVTVGHVGDSRLYRIKRNQIEKMTHDHSPVGEREDSGQLSEAEAMQHPRRNEVYRDVGSEERTPDDQDFIEILQLPFEPDSALLLCSDGLSDAVPSREVLRVVEENAGDRWATVRTLIAAANEAGKDNVSAVLIEGQAFAASFGKRPRRESDRRRPDSAAAETTDRVTALAEPQAGAPRQHRAAYFVFGALLGGAIGAALVYFAPQFLPSVDTGDQKKAETVQIPGPQTLVVSAPLTIAEVLAKAQPGDTVWVASGIYSEPVRLKSGVSVIAQHAHEAIIEGSVTAEAVQGARFEGFAVRGGDTGVRISDSEVVLLRDEIAEVHAPAVTFAGNSRGSLVACYLHNNSSGVVVDGAAAPAIENNLIKDNGEPGLFLKSTAHASVIANIFADNGARSVWMSTPDEGFAGANYFIRSGRLIEHPKFRVLSAENSDEEDLP